MRIIVVPCSFLLGLLVLSCQRNEPEPLVPAAGTVRAVDQAVDELTTARCDYEQRCQGIGPEARYSDREHCMNVVRSEARRDLTCHRGVDQDDLRECLTQIANEDCNGPFQRLEQYKDCHLDDLCAD
jgi:hypothetical protein